MEQVDGDDDDYVPEVRERRRGRREKDTNVRMRSDWSTDRLVD